MRGRKITTAVAGAAALLLGGGALSAQPALAAGAGETFLAAGLTVPPGAIAGGVAGYGPDGAEAIGVSSDGRWVAFVATADNLHPDAPLDNFNVFRKDRTTGEVTLISRADGAAGAPALRPGSEVRISDSGNRVAFVTRAGLDPGDLDEQPDVYVRDVVNGRTLLATPATATGVEEHDLSGDGAWVAFATDERLSDRDANGVSDVYRRRLAGGVAELASARDGSDQAGNAAAGSPALSGDGSWVAFVTAATDLGSGSAGGADVFVRDVATSDTYLVSNQNGSTTAGSNGGYEEEPAIAGSPASGALANVFVAYSSDGTNVDPADTENDSSVFVRQLDRPASVLVSRADGAGASADRRAHTPSISDDGQRVSFSTDAGNLGPGGGTLSAYGAYVRDVGAGRTALVSAGHDYAVQSTLSGDGRTAVWFEQFRATADGDLDLPGIFARSYATPPAILGPVGYVSRPQGDAPYRAPAVQVNASRSGTRTISGDGRWVVFSAVSHHLPGSGGRAEQVYRRDTLTGATELVSRATGPDGAVAGSGSMLPTISADGTRVAFESWAALDPADGDTSEDVYVRDLATGTTTLAGRAGGADGAAPDAPATSPAISADGRHVVFVSSASNLGGPAGDRHVYVRDLAAATTTLASRADGPDGVAADNDATAPTISGDGRLVAWHTTARNLDPADGALFDSDVYVRDLAAGTTRLVSRRSGADGQKAAGTSSDAALSDDGRVVAFQAQDETIAPEGGLWGGNRQIVARDLASGQNTLVSRAPGGAAADEPAREPAIDVDGSVVAFSSTATNLVPGLGGSQRASIFARDAATGALSGPPASGTPNSDPQSFAFAPSLSADGQCLAYVARGHNAATGAAGDLYTLYVHVLSGLCPKPLPETRQPERRQDDRRRGAPVAKPELTKVSLLRKRFRVGKGATAVTAATRAGGRGRGKAKKRKPTPAGTAIRFTLNARANVGIAIERKASGRKVGKQCRRATRRLRKKKCVRWVAAGTLKRNGTDAGRRSVAFSGRIGRKALAPGSYRAIVKASNVAGSAKPATLTFTVVRR